ncbi:MAG: hypothetical protein PSN37_01380 [Alphaproteobacteria bacterium]|nr:hypothetical protein [Alphaproteobacteria bacterium]
MKSGIPEMLEAPSRKNVIFVRELLPEAQGIVKELQEYYDIPVGKPLYRKNCNSNPEDYLRDCLSSLEEFWKEDKEANNKEVMKDI